MKIEKHIAQLLYRYQYVPVPGFGAFITSILPAEVNTFTHTFTPPRKVISFNAHLKNNDGLLANHLAVAEHIKYEEALSMIQNAVENWIETLKSTKTISLVNIGVICRNDEGVLVFEPTATNNFLTTSFGLNSYVSPAVKKQYARVDENVNSIEKVQKVIALDADAPKAQKPNYFNYAAAAIISAGTLGFVGNTFYNQQVVAENRSTQNLVRKEVNQKIQEATFFISNPFQFKKVAVGNKCFHIVAGSFRSDRNVNSLINKLKQQGHQPKVLEKDTLGVSQVLFGSYATFAEAQTVLEKIQVSENPEAWILIKNL